jgi:hypothetical protein
MAWATINGHGLRYQITDEDAIWATRMAVFETIGDGPTGRSDALAVLWTMAQLFAWRRTNAKKRWGSSSFTDLIRAYSQPINPIWYAGGRKCASRSSGPCAPSRTSHRRKIATTSYSDLAVKKPNVTAIARAWLQGESSVSLPGGGTFSLANNVPRAVEFAAPRVASYFVNKYGGDIAYKFGNHFIITDYSAAWSSNAVTVGEGRPASSSLVWAGVIAALGAGFVISDAYEDPGKWSARWARIAKVLA